jgi:hypothetical protein
MATGSRQTGKKTASDNIGPATESEKETPEIQKATACRGFHDSNCLRVVRANP